MMAEDNGIISKILELKKEYEFLHEVIDPHGPDTDNPEKKHQRVLKLPELMDMRKRMSLLSIDLAVETAKYSRGFKKLKAKHETQKYLEQRKLMTQGVKVTAAEAQAKQHVADQLEAIAIEEGLFSTGTLILKQVNETLASMRQDISIIKREYEQFTDS